MIASRCSSGYCPVGMQCKSAQPLQARRHIIAVIGDSCLDPQQLQPQEVTGDEAQKQLLAEEVGCALVEAGYRVMTGGRGGVMQAAFQGAKRSPAYREGDTIAILPGDDPAGANPYADIVIPTGLGHYRNGIVGRADAVVAVGGAEGTVQELLTAWMAEPARPIVVMMGVSGLTAAYAGQHISRRGPAERSPVHGAATAREAAKLLQGLLAANMDVGIHAARPLC